MLNVLGYNLWRSKGGREWREGRSALVARARGRHFERVKIENRKIIKS